jgi:DNA-binding MarR family transcriptional regulator
MISSSFAIDNVNYLMLSPRMTQRKTRPDGTETKTSIHQSIGYWTGLLARSMEAEFSRRLAPHGLTRMSYAVLGAMAFDNRTTPSDIAEFLGVDRAAVTRLLDKLESQNLISRSNRTDDRRSISINATPQGRELALEMQVHSLAVNAQFSGALDPGEQDKFIEMVRVMLANSDTPPESL